jgi:hypothetical protein
MEFFRHCPGCGRRFHIKVESKKLVDVKRTSRPTRVVTNIRGSTPPFRGAATQQPYFLVQEGRPMIIDVEEFQYTYKCKHCGHEWSEKHIKEQREA